MLDRIFGIDRDYEHTTEGWARLLHPADRPAMLAYSKQVPSEHRPSDRHYRLGAVPIATYVEMQSAYLEAVEALLDTQREAMEAGLRVQLLTGLDFNAVQISQP